MRPKIEGKNYHIKKHAFFTPNLQKIKKIAPERCPNGWHYFRGGASWGTVGAPVCFLTRKMHPKCSKSDPKGAKVTPKGCQSDENVSKTVRSSGQKSCNRKQTTMQPLIASWPGRLHEALKIRRPLGVIRRLRSLSSPPAPPFSSPWTWPTVV